MTAEVWVGLLQVTQAPGIALVQLSKGGAYTWFTCWARSEVGFYLCAVQVMAGCGLKVVAADEVARASAVEDAGEVLLEQIGRTRERPNSSFYGVFYQYTPS